MKVTEENGGEILLQEMQNDYDGLGREEIVNIMKVYGLNDLQASRVVFGLWEKNKIYLNKYRRFVREDCRIWE